MLLYSLLGLGTVATDREGGVLFAQTTVRTYVRTSHFVVYTTFVRVPVQTFCRYDSLQFFTTGAHPSELASATLHADPTASLEHEVLGDSSLPTVVI